MDYCAFPNEKRKRGERARKGEKEREGRGVKGPCCAMQPQGSSGLLRKKENSIQFSPRGDP